MQTLTNCQVTYAVVDGELRFGIQLTSRHFFGSDVPCEVAELGDEAVANYVEEKIAERLSELARACRQVLDVMDKACGQFSVTHDGHRLIGRVINTSKSFESQSLRIVLEQPERFAACEQLAHMIRSGERIFTDAYTLSPWVKEELERSLVHLYERRKKYLACPALFDLAERLNRRKEE